MPDLLTLSKTLGGGIPLSATLTTDEIEADCVAQGLAHNTSHVADPLPAAAGVAGLDVIAEEGLVERAAAPGAHLLARLRELAEPARGRSATCAAAACWPASSWCATARRASPPRARPGGRRRGRCARAVAEHRPVRAVANCFRIAPPLTVTEDEIDLAVDLLDAALTAVLAGSSRTAAPS